MRTATVEEVRKLITGPEMVDLYSLEQFQAKGGARTELERIQSLARRMFEELGRMNLHCAVYHTMPMHIITVTGVTEPPPGVDYSEQQKDIMAAFIRALAKRTQAICVAMLAETWFIRSAEEADVRAYKARNGDSIEGHPAAVEALFVSFECARFSAYTSAVISEQTDPLTGGTRRVLGPWEDEDKNFKRREGRFAHLLKPIDLAEN